MLHLIRSLSTYIYIHNIHTPFKYYIEGFWTQSKIAVKRNKCVMLILTYWLVLASYTFPLGLISFTQILSIFRLQQRPWLTEPITVNKKKEVVYMSVYLSVCDCRKITSANTNLSDECRLSGYFCLDTVFNLSKRVLSETEIKIL